MKMKRINLLITINEAELDIRRKIFHSFTISFLFKSTDLEKNTLFELL